MKSIDNAVILSNNIDFYRRVKGLSQEELANELEVDRGTVQSWCVGRTMPKALALYKMAKVLNCTMDDFMKGVEV